MTMHAREHNLDGYPQDRLLGVFDDEQAAELAAHELIDRGFAESGLAAFCGSTGARELDPSGAEHGLIGRLLRVAQNTLAEFDGLREYAQAADAGHCVLAVHVPDEAAQGAAHEIFERHHAALVNKFGRWTVESATR